MDPLREEVRLCAPVSHPVGLPSLFFFDFPSLRTQALAFPFFFHVPFFALFLVIRFFFLFLFSPSQSSAIYVGPNVAGLPLPLLIILRSATYFFFFILPSWAWPMVCLFFFL